jgi:hypothetical protein
LIIKFLPEAIQAACAGTHVTGGWRYREAPRVMTPFTGATSHGQFDVPFSLGVPSDEEC